MNYLDVNKENGGYRIMKKIIKAVQARSEPHDRRCRNATRVEITCKDT